LTPTPDVMFVKAATVTLWGPDMRMPPVAIVMLFRTFWSLRKTWLVWVTPGWFEGVRMGREVIAGTVPLMANPELFNVSLMLLVAVQPTPFGSVTRFP